MRQISNIIDLSLISKVTYSYFYKYDTRSQIMDKNKFSLDTCFVRRLVENPNYLDAVKARFDFTDSEFIISETVVYELESYGFSISSATEIFEQKLGVTVSILDHTTEELILAKELLEKFAPKLHIPDNQILATAVKQNLPLITCDKGLISISNKINHEIINSDKIGTNTFNILRHHLPNTKEIQRELLWRLTN